MVRTQGDTAHQKLDMAIAKRNITKNICYTKQFNGGKLTLTAAEVSLKSKDKLVLSNISANFSKNGRSILIESGECDLNLKNQKAYLRKNVLIKSPDATCNTNSAVVDFVSDSIYGNSKITGTRAGDSFTSDGFIIDKNGVIKLKHATIKRISQ